MAVLSPGLIGGSVLRAVRAKHPGTRLSAWARRPEAVAELLAAPGLVESASTDVNEAIAGADCLILAMPTGNMAEVVAQMAPFPAGSLVLVTDVGSVKAPVVREIGPLVSERGGIFIGSHPMAGSEKKGLAFADASLFEKAAVILTPGDGIGWDDPSLGQLTCFWEDLGGIVTLLDPARHDELVGAISHLPHLIAASAARVCLKNPADGRFGGGGLRDTTRVASGNPDMWAEIVTENRAALLAPLRETIADLNTILSLLENGDQQATLQWLAEAKQPRDTLQAMHAEKKFPLQAG